MSMYLENGTALTGALARNASTDGTRGTRMPRRAMLLVVGLVVAMLAAGMLHSSPANAATVVPPHSSNIGCVFGSCVVSGQMNGRSSARMETVYWYPRLQRWNGQTWQTVTSPNTGFWHVGSASSINHAAWSFTDGVAQGYYYRVLSFYYWPSTGYMTAGEPSNFDFAQQIVIVA